MQRMVDELQLLQALQWSILATDVEGRITFANEPACALYGERGTLLGRPVTDLVTNPRQADALRAGIGHVLAVGGRWREDLPVARADGSTLLAAVTATPLHDTTGAVTGVVVASEDVTDARLGEAEAASSEQRLRLAHRAAQLGTWQWDIPSGAVIWDERLEEIFGLEPHTFDGTFEAWLAPIHPDDQQEVLDVVNRAMAERSSYVLKYRVRWPDDSIHSVEAWGQVTTDAAGEPTGTIGCVRDMTSEVEARAALARALTARERAANRMEFLLGVSADLSGAARLDQVAAALRFHLERFRRLFASEAELAVPASLTSLRSGRDLTRSGYDDMAVADQVLLDGLAHQGGVAAQRADLLARTASIAEQLQVSLAASPLPDTPAFDLAVHYAPGGDELEHVGGDWYDAIAGNGSAATADDAVSIIIGDVMGRGVRAATTMIRVRAGLRALLTESHTPERLLALADELVLRDAPDQFVTTAVAVLDPAGRTVTTCSAGHVPALVVQPDGTTALLGDGTGIPLGISVGEGRAVESAALAPGTLVLMVTDGVIESRGEDLGRGLDRLRSTAVEHRDAPLGELVVRLAGLADVSLRDDVTVVAARMR
ncbi:SpoIIE family protein phosphatase [Nocardioides sp. GCM10027113]|uniref:SpoIIE family protein phosphatase n=1 Tax=unclassified Nocardioides TaxID=2615069 RepID=UPI00360C9889